MSETSEVLVRLDILNETWAQRDEHMARAIDDLRQRTDRTSESIGKLLERLGAIETRLNHLERRDLKPGEVWALGAVWTRVQVGIAVGLVGLLSWLCLDTWTRSRANAKHLTELRIAAAASTAWLYSQQFSILARCVALRFRERDEGVKVGAHLSSPDPTTEGLIAGCRNELDDLIRTIDRGPLATVR